MPHSLLLSFWLCGSLSVLFGFIFTCLCLLSSLRHGFCTAPGLLLHYVLVDFSLLSLTSSLRPPLRPWPLPCTLCLQGILETILEHAAASPYSGPDLELLGHVERFLETSAPPKNTVGTQTPDCSPIQPAVGLGKVLGLVPDLWKARSGLGLVMPAWSCLGCWGDRAAISHVLSGLEYVLAADAPWLHDLCK